MRGATADILQYLLGVRTYKLNKEKTKNKNKKTIRIYFE